VNSRSGVMLHRGACERALNKGMLSFFRRGARSLKLFEKVFVVNGARSCIHSRFSLYLNLTILNM
jgi:hypothetical protein